MTMWSLTLPQVAATLAATLVAFDTRNAAGQRLIDSRLLNVVLVLMVYHVHSWTGSYRAFRTPPLRPGGGGTKRGEKTDRHPPNR
jgi:hypothetical protein